MDRSRSSLIGLADNNPNISAEDRRAMRLAPFSEDASLYKQNAASAERLSQAYGEHANHARLIRNTA